MSVPSPTPAQSPAPDAPAVFPVPDPASGPYALTAGPDGALWCTLVHAGAVARLTPDG